MSNIPITPKDIKFLNDINQVLKKVYTRYYIFNDGFVVSLPGDTCVEGGFHFSTIPNVEKLFNLLQIKFFRVICFDSNRLYTAIKDQKKNIQSISIDEKEYIHFVTDDGSLHFIGVLLNIPPGYEPDIYKRYMEAKLKYSNLSSEQLDKSIISTLCNNELVIFDKGRYRVRLTKQVIPNIKEDMTITISFSHTVEKDLFEMTIGTIKDSIECYHSYKCLYY